MKQRILTFTKRFTIIDQYEFNLDEITQKLNADGREESNLSLSTPVQPVGCWLNAPLTRDFRHYRSFAR